MATRGFEFVYSFDGSTPFIRDYVIGVQEAHSKGDVVLLQADGFVDHLTGSIDEVTGITMEAIASADISAGTTLIKVALAMPGQIWRCSTDAATAAVLVPGIQLIDLADTNTISASDVTNGSMVSLELPSILDDDGNVIAYVTFSDTTFTAKSA